MVLQLLPCLGILWLNSSFAASYDNGGTCKFEKVTKVRVTLSPPYSLKCRENRQDFSGNCEKRAQFQDSCVETGPEKISGLIVSASFAAVFSEGHVSSPVSADVAGECNAITNGSFGESGLTCSHLNRWVIRLRIHSSRDRCECRNHAEGSREL